MLEKSQEELEQMAAAINTLAAFCGKRDLPRLSREELAIRMQGRSVFYAEDLGARYFTYRRGGQTHFVLFDDAGTLRRKIEMGQALGIREGFVMLPEVEDLTGSLFTGEG